MKRTMARTTARPALRPLTAAVAAALGTQMLGPTALAQSTDGPLEVIVVTASRRETTIQELPFNITAVGGDTLERRRLTRLSDFSRWVPGLTVIDQGTRAGNLMTVRGLNVRSIDATEYLNNTSGDTVATYLGEIPIYVDFRMKDIDRVEVLIGPQGTLYGAGTLGGAVRYIPNAPDTHEFSLDFHGNAYGLSESSGTGYDADIIVNAPIVEDKLAFRGFVSYLDDPGFIDYDYLVREPGVSNPQPDFNDPVDVAANLWRKQDANTEQTATGRLSLLWEASDSVQATFNYYFQDQDVGARTINHRASFGTGEYESAHRFLEPNKRENSLLSAEVVADLGFAELTSATGISNYDELGQRDQTDLLLDFLYGYELFPSFAAFTREIVNEKRLNQELRLVSRPGRVTWIAGLFYNKLDIDATSEEFTPGIPEFFGLAPPPLPTGDLEYLQLTQQTQTESAVFGELTYSITDRLDVSVGGRYFDYTTDQLVSFDLPLIDVFDDAQANRASDNGFRGKLNLSMAFTDSITGYATVAEGYRIGGVNSLPECLSPLPAGQNVCALPNEVLIKPDRTTNFEIGAHTMLADGRVTLNGDVYRINYRDVQTLSATVNGAIPITVNGGSARTQGLELSVEWSGNGPWSVGANYAHLDAKLTSDAPGLVDGVADAFSGDRLSASPEDQGSVFVRFNKSLDNGWDLDFNYGVTATSNVLTKVGLRNNGETLGGYAIHGASLSLAKDRWSATLYGDNLTNKFAETGVRDDPSYVRAVNGFDLRRYYRNVLRPRSIGVEFRYSL